ncbi:MAG: T9SS type A sorting domain-containing protein [Sphingobacteriales bacterium JAD_PAG50586_3]|nr:MAG: T9SS type A sorting domain-containing protein [Sphingobacteriales bacterium JAD_PAG50586_3]
MVTNSLGIAPFYLWDGDYLFSVIDCDSVTQYAPFTVLDTDTLVTPAMAICTPPGTADCPYTFNKTYYAVSDTMVDVYFSIGGQNITQLYFDYGDGEQNPFLFGNNAYRSYRVPGQYIVEAYAHTSDTQIIGCTIHIVDTLNLVPIYCNANFTYTIDTLTSLVSFTPTSSLGDHYWEFTGLNQNNSYDANATFQAISGDTIVVMHVNTIINLSCAVTLYDTIIIPVSSIAHQLQGCATLPNAEPAGDSYIYLLKLDYENNEILIADSVFTADGCYYFDDVANGDYIIKAVLDENNPLVSTTLPTYHSSFDFWFDADKITITSSASLANKNIGLITGTNPGGPGFISGTVDWADTLRASVNFSHSTIVVKDLNGTIIAYTIAQSDGGYVITNLPLGSYTIFADFAGFSGTPGQVTLTTQNQGAENVMLLLGPQTLGVKNDNAVTAITAFPNPFADVVNLQIDAKSNTGLMVSIVNAMGQLVSQTAMQVVQGKNTQQLQLGNLPAGIYSIVLVDDKNNTSHIKAVKY